VLVQILQSLFERDLLRLKTEIAAYQPEEKLWYVEKDVTNSAGNLCLHLVGNLNMYIGTVIGGKKYDRNREQEFLVKGVPRQELLRQLKDTILMVRHSLNRLSEEALQEEYPLLVFAEKTTTAYLLVHLTTHLAYHLGQINYHRRLSG